ncbi:MAG: hypothetical protein KA139_01065 [Rhodobacteraceae bacterium]|nr:hypothetical protein [Paracoccaceae bacterium]
MMALFFSPAMKLALPRTVPYHFRLQPEGGKERYVPGMHILGLKTSFATQNPWIATALSDLFDESLAIWLEKRRKYAETTPWIIQDIAMMDAALGANWASSGLSANAAMVSDFVLQSHEQALIGRDLTLAEIFPTDPGAMRG